MKRTLLALLLLTACSDDPPDTAVVFRLDAEGTLHTRITEVTLRVSGAPAGRTLEQVFQEHVVTDVDSWPLVTVVAPAGGETGRSLSYEAFGYDGDGTELGRILVRARFVDGERITLNLEFPEGCAELACAADLSCEALDGEPRCISPDRDLTGPSDGGVLPDGATDGAVDGGTDGGPLDGGPMDGGVLTVPRLRWPPNGHYTGSAHAVAARRPTLRWDPVAGAHHYEVGLDRCSNGSVIECLRDFSPEVVVAQAPTSTWRPTEPLEAANTAPLGVRYAWRVRACGSDDECGPPSEVRYLNVGRLRGDFDGDGRGDFAAGDPTAAIDGLFGAGALTLYMGREAFDSEVLLLTEAAPTVTGGFGVALASGDFDGDGFGDLAVGTNGRCLVHWGADSGLSATSASEVTLPMNGAFGRVLASVGDVDGDGLDDFVAGYNQQHQVFVVHGSAARSLTRSDPLLDPVVDGAAQPSPFAAGDVDGNGFVDIVVGRPLMGGALGEAYLFLSDGAGFGPARPLTHPDEGELGVSGSRFGFAVAHGDFDGDGFEDLAVSAPDVGSANLGRIYLARGDRTGLASTWESLERPSSPGAQFGLAMVAGDIDGDRLTDLLVGAPHGGESGSQYGQVFTFLGNGSGELVEASLSPLLSPVTEEYGFGKALSLTDADGDGLLERFVGAPEGDRVFLYYSSDVEPPVQIGPAGPVDRFPTSLAP